MEEDAAAVGFFPSHGDPPWQAQVCDMRANGLSFDIEDWFCANNLGIPYERWDEKELRVETNTLRLLDILDAHAAKGTFFVLGWIAERVPDMVREIERRGHEVATHGYGHVLLTRMTPEDFERDLQHALEVTQPLLQQPILGFRAPSFTVTGATLWAYDILQRHGLRYDSSVFPVGFHPDYGIADAPLEIHRRNGMMEVPLSCVEFGSKRIPSSGGGYFRILPYRASRWLMRVCNAQGRPVIFYLHPWELDPGQPRSPMSASKRLRHYINLTRTEQRLHRLLSDFPFVPIKELLYS